MPNWCYSHLTVKGRPNDIRKFVEDTRDKEVKEDGTPSDGFSLNQLYPIPEELHETSATFGTPRDEDHEQQMKNNVEKFGYKDWYEWAHAHWGTKWGACDVSYDQSQIEDGILTVRFNSAWSPADGLLTRISQMYPNLFFAMRCTEEGEFFACILCFENGELVAEAEFETDMPEEFQKRYEAVDENDWDSRMEVVMEWESKRDEEMHECVQEIIKERCEDIINL